MPNTNNVIDNLVVSSQFIGAGTATNDSAVAGNIGEVIQSTVLAAGALALTTAVALNVTSISLTPGDWDVSGVVAFVPAATTNATQYVAGINTVSATQPLPGNGGLSQLSQAAAVPVNPSFFSIAPVRVSLAVTTVVFLVATSAFTVAAMTAYGGIFARRVR
jgi:hypothetical protein